MARFCLAFRFNAGTVESDGTAKENQADTPMMTCTRSAKDEAKELTQKRKEWLVSSQEDDLSDEEVDKQNETKLELARLIATRNEALQQASEAKQPQ